MEAFHIMKAKFFTIVLSIVILSFGLSFGQSLSLDAAIGLKDATTIATGSTVNFNIRVTNDADAHTGIANGFRVYSPDGATWTTTEADTILTGFGAMFDLVFSINYFDTDGAGSDTIGFGGASLFGTGLTASYDDVPYQITIGPLPEVAANHDKTICLDSSFYLPTGAWKWAGPIIYPSWDGPHCYTIWDEGTDVSPVNGNLPTSFALAQNYPNPFNPTTSISFDLPVNSDVTLSIFNITGQKVTEVIDRYEAGSHVFEWDGSNAASGIYFYKLTAGDFTETKKMMLLK